MNKILLALSLLFLAPILSLAGHKEQTVGWLMGALTRKSVCGFGFQIAQIGSLDLPSSWTGMGCWWRHSCGTIEPLPPSRSRSSGWNGMLPSTWNG